MSGPRQSPERPEEASGTDTGVAVLLAVAAIAAALIGGRAAILGDSGSDAWQEAVREDVRAGARIAGDVRRLYEEDVPVALRVAEAQLLGDALAQAAAAERGTVADILSAEGGANERVADSLSRGSAIAGGDPSRALELDGALVLERLAELRAERSPELAALDPDATEERGSDRSRESSLLVATTVPVGLAFMFGALAAAFPAARRRLVIAGYAAVALGVVVAIVVEVSL